jgi:hypothetical protein
MSAKLVKKLLLQQASEFDASVSKKASQGDDEKGATSKKKRKRSGTADTAVPVHKEDILRLHVKSLQRLDYSFGDSRDMSLQRLEKKQHKASSSSVVGMVGNSRSSSAQKARPAHIPTSNKKKYAAEQKEKNLRDIAKLLKRAKQKK